MVKVFRFPTVMIIDGLEYSTSDISEATDKEVEKSGLVRFPAQGRPPWFCSGTPYGAELLALVKRNGIKGTPSQRATDMNAGPDPCIQTKWGGFKPARTSTIWAKIFGLDPNLHYYNGPCSDDNPKWVHINEQQ